MMHLPRRILTAVMVATCLVSPAISEAAASTPSPSSPWEAPNALALSPDGGRLFVACAKTRRVAILETDGLKVSGAIALPGNPSGLALTADGRALFVTCAAPRSTLLRIDLSTRKVAGEIPVGHTALAPVLAPDQKTLYLCNRFNNDISVIDLVSFKESARIQVDREPVSAAVTPDGKFLLVANHLHSGRADVEPVAARVTILDTASRQVVRQLQLPNGSGLLRDIRVSPDGRYACVTHLVSRFQLPTTQVERGWMNSNAMTLIDLATRTLLNTILLDNAESGAANPWACGWAADGQTLFVSHAGTHELSVIDFPALLARLARLPETLPSGQTADANAGARIRSEVPSDLVFLAGLRERVSLNGRGPRAAVARGSRVYVASYFSDQIEVLDLPVRFPANLRQVRLSPERPLSQLEQGEFWFNDASICFQGWQTCASCHTDDARVDALNWDLLNDGIGNPKNSKSLLLSHRTPPAMSLGVRDTAEKAVRAGIRGILFTVQPEEMPVAMDEWLKSLTPIPSPVLADPRLRAKVRKGEKIFYRSDTQCASCHPKGLYTDLAHYAVGTEAKSDTPGEAFDTPSLVEIWRTAPYLHDGSAATLHEVLVERNPSNQHGRTSQLSPEELDDLITFLQSL